ncbi:MAG: hypothetical protein J6P21_00070 [Clostridia bacterium]|nr:hypothetical protein [Clostridia bacterium]
MSKFDRKKIAIALAFTALFGNNTSAMNNTNNTSKSEVKIPQTLGAVEGASSRINQSKGLTTGQKAGIGGAALLAISATIGFTIWGIKSKNKKESDPGDKHERPSEKNEDEQNKKNKNIKKIKNLKGEYYEENIKMIREQSGMSKENIEKLIGLINDENNSFLDNIDSIWIDNDGLYGGLFGEKLTEEIIAKAGLTKGESWVKKFLDTLRGSAKIHKIEKSNKGECIIYMSEDDCARFLFGSSMVEIATADMGCKVCYRLGGA